MEPCGLILTQRVVFVVVLSFFKSTSAGTFAPNTETDNSVITGTYISVGSRDSEETTDLPRTLKTSTQLLIGETSTGFELSSTEKTTDVHPSFSHREVQTATDQSSIHADTKSWISHSSLDTSTELLSNSHKITDNTATEWDEPSSTAVVTDPYPGYFNDQPAKTETRTIRDLIVTKQMEQDHVNTDRTESISHTDSTYISTTVSRAGERTLLSITSNSTSPYTEDFSSSDTAPHTFSRKMGTTTFEDHRGTNSTQGIFSEMPSVSQGTQVQTGQPNITRSDLEVTSDSNTNSTQPLTVVTSSEEGTDTSASISRGYTFTSGSVPSSPPLVLSDNSHTKVSDKDSPTIATETPTGPESTNLDQELNEPQTHVKETTISLLTTAPHSFGDVATSVYDSFSKFLSGQQPFIPQTPRPPEPTEVLTTVVVYPTQRRQVTDEDTDVATSVPIATTTPSSTSTVDLDTTHQPQPSTTTQAHLPHTTLPHTESTRVQTTPTMEQHTLTSRTTPQQSPSSFQSRNVATDVSTLHLETSTATPGNITAHSIHTTASYIMNTTTRSTAKMPTDKQTERPMTDTTTTTAQTPSKSTPTPDHICSPQTCANGGKCVQIAEGGSRCECLPAWTGTTCTEDVDECVSSLCPPESKCVNTRGSFSCECALGYDLEAGRSCTQAKTFLGMIRVNSSLHLKSSGLHELHREILQLMNVSLSILHGYRRSTLRDVEGFCILAVNMFSMSTNVTSTDVYNSIQMSLRNCSKTHSHCTLKLHHQLTYYEESLCLKQKNRCETQYSVCNDTYGTPYCQCHEGYFKKNLEDTTCRDCGDGFKLVNGTCVECTFGFGGFNCGNCKIYGLIAKVVSPAAGGLLLIVIIALIVTCCRKDKNDINKIIFKSGDLQMSPYAEFPKSSRVPMEWGRETIEMQDNGSTKNLLHMTDIYYSPALRNADLDRNGIYPFSGLPGSRHSCIYPAQWNPSFISDDSRRRDYF